MGRSCELLVGIDPSFRRTGVSFWLRDRIVVDSVSFKDEGPIDKRFQGIYEEVKRRTDSILQKIEGYCDRSYKVVSEEPFPGGEFSSGLWALDTMLFNKIENREHCMEIVNLNTTYLSYIHQKKKYTKTESVELAKRWMGLLKENGMEIELKEKRLSNDACESFIFLMRLATIEGHKVRGRDIPCVLKEGRLLDSKEKLLYRR